MRRASGLALLAVAATGAAAGASPVARVVTIAGGGLGDRGPAASACLGLLGGIAVDRAGGVYLTDRTHRLIRRFDPAAGSLVTVAGTGGAPKGVASGPALSTPVDTSAVAFDPDGHLLFTERTVVRRLDLGASSVGTVAGTGGVVWRGGVIAEGGPAAATELGLLAGVAVAPGGEVFLADPNRGQVLRIDREGRLTSYARLLGNLVASRGGECALVFDVAVAPAGDVYFDDQCHSMIFRVSYGVPIRVAGVDRRRPRDAGAAGASMFGPAGEVGPALDATLDVPTQLAIDGAGNLYFGAGHGTLEMVDGRGRIHRLVGPELSRSTVSGVAVAPDGDVFFASNLDVERGQLLRWSPARRTVTLVAGSGLKHCCGDGAPSSAAVLSGPRGVAVAANGDLVIADRGNHRIRRVDARTARIATVAGGGEYELPGAYHNPWRDRPALPAGRVAATKFEVPEPTSVVVDPEGNVLFAQSHGPIFRIDASDGALTTVGRPRSDQRGSDPFAVFNGIGGIACGARGETIVAAQDQIWKITAGGDTRLVAGTGRTGFFGDGGPAALADLAGASWPVVAGDGRIFFSDTGNNRIRMIADDGTISTVAGNGQPWASGAGEALRESVSPASGLVMDASGEGVLYASRGRIWRLDPRAGTIAVVAGTDEVGTVAPPDGPLAAVRQIGRPVALAVGRRGVLYFSEPEYDRVRTFVPAR